jgi:hypothetical protein
MPQPRFCIFADLLAHIIWGPLRSGASVAITSEVRTAAMLFLSKIEN